MGFVFYLKYFDVEVSECGSEYLKEIKNNENRVAMTPAGVVTITKFGHEVFIETGAGLGSGFSDEDYQSAGAKLAATAEEAWSMEMVMKVKEPLPSEYSIFP